MLTRSPFVNLPSGCVTLAFDVDIIPPSFTFCTVPVVTQPTVYAMTFNMNVPDNIVVPFCPCIPTIVGSRQITIQPDYTGVIDLRIEILPKVNVSGFVDCCDPQFTMALELNIPCMPASFTGTANITVVSNPLSKGLALTITKLTGCNVAMALDLRIPCMPLAIDPGVFSAYVRENNAAVSAHATLLKLMGCRLQASLDLAIPCMPLTVYDSTGSMTIELPTMVGTHLSTPMGAQVDLLQRTGCGLQPSIDIQIPCMPLGANGTVSGNLVGAGGTAGDSIAGQLTFTKQAGCVLAMKLDLQIPCLPIGGTGSPCRTGAVVRATRYTEPRMSGLVTLWMDTGCTLKYDAIQRPQPFDVKVVGADVWIYLPADSWVRNGATYYGVLGTSVATDRLNGWRLLFGIASATSDDIYVWVTGYYSDWPANTACFASNVLDSGLLASIPAPVLAGVGRSASVIRVAHIEAGAVRQIYHGQRVDEFYIPDAEIAEAYYSPTVPTRKLARTLGSIHTGNVGVLEDYLASATMAVGDTILTTGGTADDYGVAYYVKDKTSGEVTKNYAHIDANGLGGSSADTGGKSIEILSNVLQLHGFKNTGQTTLYPDNSYIAFQGGNLGVLARDDTGANAELIYLDLSVWKAYDSLHADDADHADAADAADHATTADTATDCTNWNVAWYVPCGQIDWLTTPCDASVPSAAIAWDTMSASVPCEVIDWSTPCYPFDGRYWELGGMYPACYGASIGSDVNTLRIDLTNCKLYGASDEALDWTDCQLKKSGADITLNWESGILYDPTVLPSGVTVATWIGRSGLFDAETGFSCGGTAGVATQTFRAVDGTTGLDVEIEVKGGIVVRITPL